MVAVLEERNGDSSVRITSGISDTDINRARNTFTTTEKEVLAIALQKLKEFL